MSRLMYGLWGIAEQADFDYWRPRFFWRWVIKRLDRYHGWHHLDSEYDP